MEYRIIVADNVTDSLATMVNKALSEGWVLQGGVTTGGTTGGSILAQAMVRTQ